MQNNKDNATENRASKSKQQHYLVPWIGGKRLLRKTIVPMIPEDIDLYCEPFGGGGWILFAKEEWAKIEIYNDLDGDLVNLFRVVKFHLNAFLSELKYTLNSREMFNQAMEQKPITDIQRAVVFYYILTKSFGSKMKNYATGKKSRGNSSAWLNAVPRIEMIAERLDKVNVENRDFQRVFKQYDHEGAFFYCDPPYSAGAGYSVVSCEDFDHERLFQQLKKLKGRWLLSYNDCEMVREMYAAYDITEVVRKKGINNYTTKDRDYRELLIKNY